LPGQVQVPALFYAYHNNASLDFNGSGFFNPDFAIECTHKYSFALRVALSIELIFAMELFLNRSVKKLNLAALKDREILHLKEAARLSFLTDQVFYVQTQNPRSNA
jgi:hypothetical protein